MGLDGVEIVQDVEKVFGIELSDGEASTAFTPGQLAALVSMKLGARPRDTIEAHALSRLRAALSTISGRDEGRLEAATALADVLPDIFSASTWRRLSTVLGLRLPAIELRRSERRRVLLFFGGPVIAFLLLFACLSATWAPPGHTVALLAVCALLAGFGAFGVAIGFLVNRPEGRHVPRECRTVGDLAARIVNWNEAQLTSEVVQADEDIWRRVQKIVAEQLGLEVEQVTKDARFVEDLGLN